MPPNTVSVARPTRYGNPFVVGDEVEIRYGCAQSGGVLLYDGSRTLYGDVTVHTTITAEMAVEMYRTDLDFALVRPDWPDVHPDDLAVWQDRVDAVEALRGKNLACYCALDQPCHRNVLLEYANR